MGPEDVFITVQERFGEAGFAVRPEHFTLADKTGSEVKACLGGNPQFDDYWFGFADAGRGFHVLVAVGRQASPERRTQALALLDSFRFQPGPQGVHLDGDLVMQAEDQQARLSWSMVPPWRRYDWRLTSVQGERLALGTFDLSRSPRDPNCSPGAAIDALPPDGAFIYVFEYAPATDSARSAFPDGAERVFGAERPYECLGDSQMVRWQDHRRAFQAHVYFGRDASPDLKRAATSIVNSIQAR
jgi:hypothetical protein